MAKKANTGDNPKQIFFEDYLRKKDADAIRFMLNNEDGRWFIARLLRAEGLTASSFTGNSSTFYNEGRRAVAIGIRDRIEDLGKPELQLLQQAECELYEAEHYNYDTDNERSDADAE